MEASADSSKSSADPLGSSAADQHLEEDLCYMFADNAPRAKRPQLPDSIKKEDATNHRSHLWYMYGMHSDVAAIVDIKELRDQKVEDGEAPKADDVLRTNFRKSALRYRAAVWRQKNGVFISSEGAASTWNKDAKAILEDAADFSEDQWFFGVIGMLNKNDLTMTPPIDKTLRDEERMFLPSKKPDYPLPAPRDVSKNIRDALKKYHEKTLPSFKEWKVRNSHYFPPEPMVSRPLKAVQRGPPIAPRAGTLFHPSSHQRSGYHQVSSQHKPQTEFGYNNMISHA